MSRPSFVLLGLLLLKCTLLTYGKTNYLMLIKPKVLQKGSRIAAVTLSWGGPGAVPHRYEAGKQQLEDAFGVELVSMEHTMKPAEWIRKHPEARAQDLMTAFKDPDIDGIISTIGGSDSIRLIPFIDLDVIRDNPKVFLGYSDTTVTHFACLKAGIVSFYGPSIMAGFGENGGLFPYMEDSVRKTLFSTERVGKLLPNTDGWTKQILPWEDPKNQSIKRQLQPSLGWNFIQGQGQVNGHLIGGCLEVLEFLKCTPYWPTLAEFENGLLFLETSEEAPSPEYLKRFLRNLAVQGVLERMRGILLGRPGGEQINPEQFSEYDQAVLDILQGEFSLGHLCYISGLDFGHSDPMFVVPQGILAEADFDQKSLSLLESAVS